MKLDVNLIGTEKSLQKNHEQRAASHAQRILLSITAK